MVVSDIVMPGLDGIAATRALLARHPGSRIVLVTVHDDPELAERGYAAGALACVLKLVAPTSSVPAVRAVLRGERYVSRPYHQKRPAVNDDGGLACATVVDMKQDWKVVYPFQK